MFNQQYCVFMHNLRILKYTNINSNNVIKGQSFAGYNFLLIHLALKFQDRFKWRATHIIKNISDI